MIMTINDQGFREILDTTMEGNYSLKAMLEILQQEEFADTEKLLRFLDSVEKLMRIATIARDVVRETSDLNEDEREYALWILRNIVIDIAHYSLQIRDRAMSGLFEAAAL